MTGAAQSHLLYHAEVVPAGTKFQVRIRGRGFFAAGWKDAAELILRGLERFNTETIRLGAGESNGWGICKWAVGAVRVMDAAALKRWMENPVPLDTALATAPDRSSDLAPAAAAAPAIGKRLDLTLRFDGHPFLVNDPTKTGSRTRANTRTPPGAGPMDDCSSRRRASEVFWLTRRRASAGPAANAAKGRR